MKPDETNLHAIFVADRQDALLRVGAALRAERERDHRRDHAITGTEADHRPDLAPRRVRLGRWLVAVGQAIAGSRASTTEPPGRTGIAATADAPCGDGHDHLASAA